MPKRIGVFGVSEEVLRVTQLLGLNDDIAVVRYWADDRQAAIEHAYALGPEIAAEITPLLVDDVDAFIGPGDLDAVIDAGGDPSFQQSCPDAVDRGLTVVSPLTARLLWAYGMVGQDRKAELLMVLAEIVESVDLAIDSDELFQRMLEVAVGATGADGGSLMLLDPDAGALSIRVAAGVEPELWPKIRVPLGDGIAGRVAADARPIHLRGKADAESFNIVRERFDIESAFCVPLVESGRVIGVLNLHHSSEANAFDDDDLAFLEQLAQLDAKIIGRYQTHESLRNQAARFNAVRQVQAMLGEPSPLLERLSEICHLIAERVGDGIATVYLHDDQEQALRLAATSLEGGGFGGEYKIVKGQGIDGRVAQTGKPAILRGNDGSPAYLCLPLHAGDRLVGVLSIQAGERPARGRAAEEVLLEMAAAMAEGVARENREARIATRVTRTSAINEAGIRMIGMEDMGEVARLATSSAAMILEAEHAVLRLQDEQTLRYVIRSYFGPADGRQQERLFRLDKDITVETIRRRTALVLRHLDEDSRIADSGANVRSLMAAPLKRDGNVIGTFSIYERVASDHFYPVDFSEDDFQIFTRLVSYVERAVQNAHDHAVARRNRNFDDQTGLPNASYLSKRIDEEISRSHGRDRALAIATCAIENLEDIRTQSGPVQAHRVIQQLTDALRTRLRDFDVLGRTDTARFTILLPDPGHVPDQRVADLAKDVSDAISKADGRNDSQRVQLSFGHAVYPTDGESRVELIARAEEPRIRMG